MFQQSMDGLSSARLDPTAPIVIVGAGRSGTTRLVAVLGDHPDVYMMGETSFLLPRLWDAFFQRPAYVRNSRLGHLAKLSRDEWRELPWWAFWNDKLGRRLDNVGPVLDELESAETAR